MGIPATFPCLGKIYNCTTDSTADPDVVGIGVMAAFLATSVATFATILIAYFGGYLPGIEPNDVDYLLLRKRRGELKNDSPKVERRKKAVEEFILTLSDQQLVTGLAILIAGFVKCDISVYSFENVSAIAWFSCTTHLATLTILKRYLQEHRLVLVLRIIGMLLIAGLLIASNFMTTTAKSTAKAWRQSAGLESGLDLCFYCIFNSGSRRIPGSFGIDIIILLWLLWAYPGRIRALHSSEDPDFRRELIYPIRNGYSRLYEDPVEHHKKYSSRVRKICKSDVNDSEKDFFCRVYLALFFYQEMTHSYWWEIVWLLFAGAFSLSRVLLVWFSFSDISGNRVLSEASTAMGFGQMAAPLFLALPCFAALEAFSGQEETKVTPGETKVTPEEAKLKSAEPEVKKRKPRIVFDQVTKSEMPATELHRLQRERKEESGRKSQLVSQMDNPLESSQEAALEPTPPDAGHGPSKISNEQTSQLEIEHKSIPPRAFSDAEDDDDSKPREQIDKLEPERQPSRQPCLPDGEEQTDQPMGAQEPSLRPPSMTIAELRGSEELGERTVAQWEKFWMEVGTEVSMDMEKEEEEARQEEARRQAEASNQATRIELAMERCLNKRLSEGYADPYQVGGYKHLLGIFAFLYSTYIIGIGVTMAIAPNVRTLVHTSILLVPEASVKVVGVIVQVRLDWRRYRRVVVSQAKRRDLEHAGRKSREKQIFDRVSQVQRSDYERSYERDRHHLMTRG